MYKHILVPIDGTALSGEVITRSLELAGSVGARITFFYANPDYAADSEGALFYTIAPEVFIRNALGSAKGYLAKAEVAARAAGVPCDVLTRVSDRPHEVILDTAEKLNCDLIFMASHGSRGLKSLMIGSQTLKVLAGAKIPVLVSAIETNATTPMRNKAIAVFQDEHRSIAAVLHGLSFLVSEAHESGAKPELKLMEAMISFVTNFTSKQHHPKEDEYLFPRLSTYTHELDHVIAILSSQHEEEKPLLKKLEEAFSDYESGQGGGYSAFKAAVDEYTRFIWRHMAFEEKQILPAARNYFTEDDWKAIAEAFGKNGDPRFGEENYREFKNAFTEITNRNAFPVGVGSTYLQLLEQ